MKVQRIIMNSETSLRHFIAKNFKFTNLKFLDLHKAIPDHEKEEFFIYEKYHANILKYFSDSYYTFMEVMFKQTRADRARAKRRYRYVVAISRTYQVVIYAIFLKICYHILQFFANKI